MAIILSGCSAQVTLVACCIATTCLHVLLATHLHLVASEKAAAFAGEKALVRLVEVFYFRIFG